MPPPMLVLLAELEGCLGLTDSTAPIDRYLGAGVDVVAPAVPGT